MNEQSEIKRLLKGVFVGGLSAVVSLIATMALVGIAGQEQVEYSALATASGVLIISVPLTVWGAGFWGRWGMVLFFLVAPIVIVLDWSMNPLFPSGVILLAAVCYGLFSKRASKNA